jgi:hypothetical protein
MKPSKTEDRHIWEHELKCRLQNLVAEQQATAAKDRARPSSSPTTYRLKG